MHATTWQIEEHTAALRASGLAAQLNLVESERGLSGVVAGGRPWNTARLLGLGTDSLRPSTNGHPVDAYVRGNDLILLYTTTPQAWMRVDALWRAVTPDPGETFIAAVDLIVSVQTQLLEAWPELTVQSTLPTCERLQPDKSSGCLLFRQADMSLSYVEMVQPADLCCDESLAAAWKEEASCLVHRLFRSTLEKGVILRARVRGVFVPRIDDTRIAAACYSAFAAADPPLGM